MARTVRRTLLPRHFSEAPKWRVRATARKSDFMASLLGGLGLWEAFGLLVGAGAANIGFLNQWSQTGSPFPYGGPLIGPTPQSSSAGTIGGTGPPAYSPPSVTHPLTHHLSRPVPTDGGYHVPPLEPVSEPGQAPPGQHGPGFGPGVEDIFHSHRKYWKKHRAN